MTYLYISHQINSSILNLQRKICMHALPMLMKELIRQALLLVEEDKGSEVWLLIRSPA